MTTVLSIYGTRQCPSQTDGSLATNVGLGSTELELDKANFCFFDSCRTASSDDDILVKYNPIDEFGVFYSTANLLDDTDIS
jgi:hypothetical protein